MDGAGRSSGADLALSRGRGPNPEIVWRDECHRHNMGAKATFLSKHYVPIRTWSIRPNHPDIPRSPPIRGYELLSVMADQISAISRRIAAQDIHDLNSLLSAGVDMNAGWALFVAHHQQSDIQYGWQPHPNDIRATYLRHRDEFAATWDNLVQTGWLPPASFNDVFTNVDNAIRAAIYRWNRELA